MFHPLGDCHSCFLLDRSLGRIKSMVLNDPLRTNAGSKIAG